MTSAAFNALGVLWIFLPLITYLADTYQITTASALAATVVVRSLVGNNLDGFHDSGVLIRRTVWRCIPSFCPANVHRNEPPLGVNVAGMCRIFDVAYTLCSRPVSFYLHTCSKPD